MSRQSSSLPPYLTSGASSRAHHGLLVKLHEAASIQEEDEIISGEIKKAKEVLNVRGQSTGKISDTLVILLHCLTLRHQTEDDVDFALISALQLAESGKTLAERRIGYLYLVERLPKGHELNLLLINTIRKDLSSATPSHILLALQTISKIPSSDLAPAVIPILTSKSLLKNKLPAIRQRTFEALLNLHRVQPNEPFPLSMNKLLKSLSHEDDLSVLAVVFRSIRYTLETGVHRIETEEEKLYVIERCIASARDKEISSEGQVSLEVVRTLSAVLAEGETSIEGAHSISKWIIDVTRQIDTYTRWEGAFLLEACSLSKNLPAIRPEILYHISKLLLPDPKTPSSSTSAPLPTPNNHVLALRCLGILPTDVWDGVLGEREMAIIMEGVNSVDDTIRRLTIKLLQSLSPELPNMIFRTHLESIRSSTDLSLPLSLANNLSIEEKTRIGRVETASRALEVVEVQYSDNAEEFVKGVIEVIGVLDGENNDTRAQRNVWDEGARRILRRLDYPPPSFAELFAISLLEQNEGKTRDASNTILVILTSITCEYLPASYDQVKEAINYFVAILPKVNASIQELILVTLISLSLRLRPEEIDHGGQVILEAVHRLEEGSSRYLKKRCEEISTIIRKQLLEEVRETMKSFKLADILVAIISVNGRYSLKISSSQSPPASAVLPPRADLSASQLRYDAYQPPKISKKDREQYRDHLDDDSD